MRRTASFGIVLALAGALVGHSTAGSWADDEKTIKAIERFTSDHFVDNAPEGESAGDSFVATADIFKNKGGKAGAKLGTGVVSCVIIEVNPDAGRFIIQCHATWSLEDGTLEFSALINEAAPPPHTFDIAVIGGTGDFRKARGDGKATENSEEENVITLKIS